MFGVDEANPFSPKVIFGSYTQGPPDGEYFPNSAPQRKKNVDISNASAKNNKIGKD